MKVFKRAALLAAMLTVGCMDQNPATIQVFAARPFEEGCVVQPGGDIYVPWGYLDLSFDNRVFVQGFDVRNNLQTNDDETSFRLNTNDFVMERAVVTYTGTDGPDGAITTGLASFSTETPLAGTIEAGGQAGVIAELIPSRIAEALRGLVPAGAYSTVLAEFTIEGHTQDLAKLESSRFSFPVNVCNGCIAEACAAEDTLVFECFIGQAPFTCVPPEPEEEPVP